MKPFHRVKNNYEQLPKDNREMDVSLTKKVDVFIIAFNKGEESKKDCCQCILDCC